jgi:methionyl-tRNA synthetase
MYPLNEFELRRFKIVHVQKNPRVLAARILEEFPETQDVLRYALTSNAQKTKDNDFTLERFSGEKTIMSW